MATTLFQRIDSVFAVVDDLAASVSWYEQNLGIQQVWRNEHAAILRVNDSTPVTLVRKESAGESHPIFNFYTTDIERAHRHLEEKGVEVGPIQDYGELRAFGFKDNAGNPLSVCYVRNGQQH